MKTVVVTGCSRGLGLEITRRLLGEGFRVIGLSRSPPAEDAFEGLADSFGHVPVDLGDLSSVQGAVRRVRETEAAVFGLVNNAGLGLGGMLTLQPMGDIEAMLRINLLGPISLTRALVRPMLARQQGRIVNVTSIVAQTGYKGLAAYAATKAGLEGFSKSLARELGPANITVNCVAPGFLATDMTSGVGHADLDRIAGRSALRRLASPATVAGVVSMLLGPDGVDVSGATYVVDAGTLA